jgi:hypothetical protein
MTMALTKELDNLLVAWERVLPGLLCFILMKLERLLYWQNREMILYFRGCFKRHTWSGYCT